MIRFECDYLEGAHPKILERLAETNLCQAPGYGADEFCARAREKILALCARPEAQVHFFVGGTQANLTVIAALLRPHQGVLCAHTGHIGEHESGAVEATGHKVLPLPGTNGKLTPAQVQGAHADHCLNPDREHIVQPGMVYISHPTECGTVYTKAELTALSETCRALGLPLFLDGARLGYGLSSPESDLTLPDIAALCDVFYIGGTKVGALLGEAVVLVNPRLQADFRYIQKQRGALLAKGRVAGLQFDVLLEDGLYFEISARANTLARLISAAFTQKGFPLRYPTETNQVFPILPEAAAEWLGKKYAFSVWERPEPGHIVARFCTSWATPPENARALAADIAAL